MGCGVVCGLQTKVNNYLKYSKKHVQQLIPFLKKSKPFLSQNRYKQFLCNFSDKSQCYILNISELIGQQQNVQQLIMQKWKVLLYGLDKSDEIYKKCLSFQVRNQKQNVTNEQRMIKNNSSLMNSSIHQIKRDPQYHQCFKQIEKDLNRTFQFKIQKKQIFQNVLKRISNYFPSMGYTQGVNFIVGYLLVLGYSQVDTFWMFVHMAINKRYLILGMYQDGFPLTYIYTLIFKNILKRKDFQLYNHFFNNLILDESMWVFKWFITYYIYSFPFSLIKHIWNLVIQIGGLALVYFAISLVLHLRTKLLSIDDPCDMSQFLQTLKDTGTLNKLLKINKVIQYTYQIKVLSQDFQGLNQLRPSFYKQYYKIIAQKLKEQQKQKNKGQNKEILKYNRQQISALHQWYGKLLIQRYQFQHKEESQKLLTLKSINVPENMKNQYQDLQKSIKLLQQKVIKNQSIKYSSQMIKDSQKNSDFFDDLIYQQSYQIESKPQIKQNPLPVVDMHKKSSLKMSYEMNIQAEINQVQQFSDSNHEQLQQNLQNMIQQQSYFNDEIAERNPKQYALEIQKKYQLKVNNLVGSTDHNRKYNKELTQKANNIKPFIQQNKKRLCIVGQNIINNLSITNSQHTSSISSNNNFRPKKQKQNIIRPKNQKIRTQQRSQPSIQPSQCQSADKKTQKSAFSRIIKRDSNLQSQIDFTNIKYNVKTDRQFMNNSHIHNIQQINNKSFIKDENDKVKTQIQIFNGNNLFKKNKKESRNSNNMSILNHYQDNILSQNRYINSKVQYKKQIEEESIQYIIYPPSMKRYKIEKKDQMENYQIQSIKASINNL